MNRLSYFSQAGLALMLGATVLASAVRAECGNHGTSVEFVETPSAAGQKALKEHKLVFVLHVSGHFEDPRFT